MILEIKNLCVSMDNKPLLHNINLKIKSGERHRLAGHNGSGKSTLVNTIAGNPLYSIDSGQIIFNGHDITNENATNRALQGIFLGAQNVPEIPGLTLLSFLKHSMIAHTHYNTGKNLSMAEFLDKLEKAREQLNIPQDWLNRFVNVGFSGGERKRIMLLRLILTQPMLAILDEPDSGADKDVQAQIINTINSMPKTTFLFLPNKNSLPVSALKAVCVV